MPSLILLFGLVLASPPAAAPQDPVAIEFRVRRAALWNLESAGLAQPGEDWRERYWALEALNRRAVGRLSAFEVQFAGRFLGDEQSDVRGLALAVHARHALAVPSSVGALRADPLPHVRQQLARSLVHCPDSAALGWLSQLVMDADVNVAREAISQLFALGPRALAEQRALLVRDWNRLAPELFLHLLDVLDRSNAKGELIASMRPLLQSPPPALGEAEPFLARLALWATLKDSAPDPRWWTLLAEQWLTPLQADKPELERTRRKRLERFAVPLAFRDRMVERLLESAEEWDARARTQAEDSAMARWRADEWMAAAVEVHFASPSSAVFPMRAGWGAELAESAWVHSFGRADSWDASALIGLRHAAPGVRLAAWDTLAEIWGRSGGLDPESWLGEILQDPVLAPHVYRTFLHSKRTLPEGHALSNWWAAQETGTQLECLREHHGGRVDWAWREGLIELWRDSGCPSHVVLESLARFRGDDDLARRLMGALQEQLQVLDAAPVPPEEVTRGPWRAAEARATWLLEAWLGTRSRGGRGMAERVQLLLRVGQLDKQLGKTLVSDLAGTHEGREGLSSVVQAPELSARVRYEILLLHEGLQPPEQVEELFSAYSHCDEELQLRILRRAEGSASSLGRALLEQVVFDREASPALRQAALFSIQHLTPNALAVELLRRVLHDVADYELKLAALTSLGEIAQEHQSLRLLELHDDALQRSLFGDELLAAMVRIEVRGAGALSAQVRERWQAQPASAAWAEQEARFVSKRLPARNFAYAGWLAAASQLAAAGWVEEAMGTDWWQWDGRLLMRLAEVVGEAGGPQAAPLTDRIQQAARVALLGEGYVGERGALLVRLRARLMLSAVEREDWPAAGALVGSLLDDWRSGRTNSSAIESVFGTGRRDPREYLLGIELECRARESRR